MKSPLLARITAATELVRKHDLGGGMAAIKAALMDRDGNEAPSTGSGDPPQSTAAGPRTLLPRSPAPNKAAAQSWLGRRARRPLADVLAAVRKRPFAGALTPGLSVPNRPRGAPDPLPDGATFETLSYAIGASRRNYKLYVPRPAEHARRPLVVMLHGCTQDADDFALGTRMNRLADEWDVIIAYPEQPATANNLRCWNWFNPQDQRRDAGEPALIAGITRSIMATHAIDPQRIFVAGLSAGGAMAAIMAMTYPDIFSAVGVHSGLPYEAAFDIPSAFAAMRNGHAPAVSITPPSASSAPSPRCIVFHGEADATVHPANGERLFSEACQLDGISVDESGDPAAGTASFRRRVARTRNGHIVAEHWTIAQAGHAWSGGDARGSYTTTQGPDASREMMRFFLQEPPDDSNALAWKAKPFGLTGGAASSP